MTKILTLPIILLLLTKVCYAESTEYYGKGLCSTAGYSCINVDRGATWEKLWPDAKKRDLVQRLNRTDSKLRPGMIIAVPNNLDNITLFDIAPFPKKINNKGEKIIIVDQDKLAWGAFNQKGELIKWGPISSGKDYCSDVNLACKTVTGIFHVFNKKDKQCQSNVFPVGEGGANMPYCMFFYKGFALHGSDEVFGFRDSHGCVRLFVRDAKWLNYEFVELPSEKNRYLGTKIVIQKLETDRNK